MRDRILIVNVNWVGDVIFSTPFIRAVRQAHPDGHIACLLHPRCREVLEGSPRIDEIIIYDEEGVHRSLAGKARLILELRRRRFDTAFLLHRSFTKALIVYLAGIGKRVGYATKKREVLLTDIVEEPFDALHKVEYFLNIAKTAGIDTSNMHYEFFVSEADRDYAKGLLAENGVRNEDVLVAINPGGNWDPKRWPRENFSSLADRLMSDYGVKVMITGARKDVGLAEEIKGQMKNAPIVTCGKTTLKQLAALFERSRLVISNDTGPMHIACAVGASVIALFGPTASWITGPFGKGEGRVISKAEGCEVPCYNLNCADYKCMNAISVEDVLREADKVLGKK